MLKKIKIFLRTLGDRLGFHFYSRPNHFKVHYSVELTNQSEEEKSLTLILPVPSNTDYQTINQLHFSTNPTEQNSDNRGNKYVVWRIDLKQGEQKEIGYDFKIDVKPRNNRCKTGSLDEYKHLSADLTMTSLESNKFIHPHEKSIKRTAEKIIQDAEAQDEICKIIEALNEHLIQKLQYGDPILGLYPSTAALTRDCVDCGGYNTFLIGMCRSLGIPARNVSGFWLGYKGMKHKMHAWMEVLLPNGEWMPLDPSSEQLFKQGRMWASGRLGFTGSDRVAMSFGEDILISAGNKQHSLEILQNPVVVPEEDIEIKINFEEK